MEPGVRWGPGTDFGSGQSLSLWGGLYLFTVWTLVKGEGAHEPLPFPPLLRGWAPFRKPGSDLEVFRLRARLLPPPPRDHGGMRSSVAPLASTPMGVALADGHVPDRGFLPQNRRTWPGGRRDPVDGLPLLFP